MQEVADDRVEPHVDPLVVAFLVTRNRNRNTPVQITRDRTGLELLHKVEREAADVLPPTVLPADPFGELLLERRQIEKQVLGRPKDRRRAESFFDRGSMRSVGSS